MNPATTVALRMPAARRHVVDATMFWSARGGGVGRYLREKSRWAARAGWRSTWVVPHDAGARGVAVGGVPLPASGGYRLPLPSARHAALLVRLRPDVIESGDPFALSGAVLNAAHTLGVPAVAFLHTDLAEQARRALGRTAARAVRAWLRRRLAPFDAVFAASGAIADMARDLGLDNVVRQPLGVDLQRFRPTPDARWRAAHGLADEARVLLFVGRFAVEKNLPLLVRAVDRLGPPYVLVALGAGPHPPRGTRVRLLPYCSDPGALAAAYSAADVFVHGGTRETFGLAALEALACGTPVVLPARAGFLDLIDGRAAIGVEPRAEALAEAVRAMGDVDRALLSQRARAAAAAFDQQRAFALLFARYDALRASRRNRHDH
jgi:alpha-1,6-mannosyltransferase